MAREMGREVKLFILIAVVGAFIGAGIVIAVKLPKNLAIQREIAEQSEEMRLDELEIDVTDLKIPVEFAEIWKTQWYPYRPRMPQWTTEQARKFHVDPEKIGSTILELRNTDLMEELFEDVP